jgi:glycyl-tRNA synthetase beta chain
MKRRDLLLELGTEELPTKSLLALSQALSEGLVMALSGANLAHGAVDSFAGPRRLAVLVRRLTEQAPEQVLERKGPPVSAAFDAAGAPTRAALAFAESCGADLTALSRRADPKGEFLYYAGRKAGALTSALLPALIEAVLQRLPIAKRMRWGSGSVEFVRPVHWVVLLFGSEVVPAVLLGVASGAATRGHRFMADRAITLRRPASYARRLEQSGYVLASFAERRARIAAAVAALASEAGGSALLDGALLDEVTALVEWPVPLLGQFEARFLSLPPEVLIATLADHQRNFPLRDAGGGLMARFITVANLASRDPAEVRAGNERVVRARLADAAFFWDGDRRQRLATRQEALARVSYQAGLGSYAQKSRRLEQLAVLLAGALGAPLDSCARAAALAKCDLLTGVVGEFPELQGTMGGYYARHDGESAEVATAISEQYLPRHAGDDLPRSPAGRVLAIADKLDTLVGSFALGQKPIGTKDPFGLRRAALGILRISLESGLDLDLPALVAAALATLGPDLAPPAAEARSRPDSATVAREVHDYLLERLRALYLDARPGLTPEMIDAVVAKRPASPLDFAARLTALEAFLARPEAASLTLANKRIANILKKTAAPPARLHASLYAEPAERALGAALARLEAPVRARVERREYGAALAELASLRASVDAFFDQVLVMADDPALRANRLALLAALRELFLLIADLSRLPG